MEIENYRQILNNAGIGKKPTTMQVDKVDIWCSDWHIPKCAVAVERIRSSASQPFAYMTKIVKVGRMRV